MFIKQFRARYTRVPDPLRPGKRVLEERLFAAGTTSLVDGGSTYQADDDGWIEVPDDLGARLVAFRFPGGERWHTPWEVDEQVRMGAMADGEGDLPAVRPSKLRGAGRRQKPADAGDADS